MKGEGGRGIVVYSMTLHFELGGIEFLSQEWVNICKKLGGLGGLGD